MLRTFCFFLLFSCSSLIASEEAHDPRPKIRFKMEVAENELASLDLKRENIYSSMVTKLVQNQIFVHESEKNPMLVLRLKTIEVSGDQTVGFVQLAFFEEAELKRNKSTIWAMTWSQGTLLTAAKRDFAAQASKTLDLMIASFATEFHKAFVIIE